jgi:hypothetical protein
VTRVEDYQFVMQRGTVVQYTPCPILTILCAGTVVQPRGLDDVAEWTDVQHAMKVLGMTQEQVSDVYTVVGAVMWLGNIRFQEVVDAVDGDAEIAPSGGAEDGGGGGEAEGGEGAEGGGEGGSKLDGAEYADLHRTCALLQVARGALELALCTRNMKVLCAVPIHSCTHTPMHPHTHAPMHPCTHAPMHPCTHPPTHALCTMHYALCR